MSDRDKGKIKLNLFLISIVFFQIIVVSLILSSNLIIEYDDSKKSNEDSSQKTIKGDTILPNLTRTYEPIVLSNETASEIWSKLHGHHIDNIRIAYYSTSNEWTLVSFQLDEKAYFRTYKYELSFQFDISFTAINQYDLTNWGHFDVEHRYAGKHINDTLVSSYEEPTKYECEMSYWHTRQQENYNSPDTPPTVPIQDPDELSGGSKEQLKRRIDWDDELCFYAEKGKKATSYNWWNYYSYPYRYQLKIIDSVDNGISWMYIYYNNYSMDTPPSINYYIPPSDQDYVMWDKFQTKIHAENYELTIDALNNDLDSEVRIDLPGYPPNVLYEQNNREYFSSKICLYEPGMSPLNSSGETEMWRDGEWDDPGTNTYNEKITTIGYNLQMDFGFDDSGGDWSGHRINSDLIAEGVPTSQDHECNDNYEAFMSSFPSDHADHDGDLTEIVPFMRGILETSGTTNEAAIDGPCRVILDKFTLQNIKVYFSPTIEYEEFWVFSSQRLKYYASMMQSDPYTLDFNISESETMDVDIEPHFMFLQTQRFSDFVRMDLNSYILMGAAPNGETGIHVDFPQANPGTKTWPLYLYPDEDGNNDGVLSGGGPEQNHYDNSHLLPGSGMGYGSNPAANNPLGNWKYLHTSFGGAWSYIPYQELWQMFTTKSNRDLATYWNDNYLYSEWGIYGNHGDVDGISEFCERTVFTNLTHWECLREYARMKYPLENTIESSFQDPGTPPYFEGTEVFINGNPTTGVPWVIQGDQVDILIDLNSDFQADDFNNSDVTKLVDDGNFTVEQIDALLYIYNLSFVVDTINPDRAPPLPGYLINITLNFPSPSYIQEEFYLDNTDPIPPSTFSANQVNATTLLTWSGEYDNGEITKYHIFRNGSLFQMLDPPVNQYVDNVVIFNRYYTYFIRVYDKVGHSADSSIENVYIDPAVFVGAQPDPLPQYTNGITINWSSNPGTPALTSNFRVHWANNPGGPYSPIEWLPSSQRTYSFDPLVWDLSPANKTYYFRLESITNEGGGYSKLSGIVSTFFDTESPLQGVLLDIPDHYCPDTPLIQVRWAGQFDAFSGIDYFILERSSNGASGPWILINTFTAFENTYDDTDVISNTEYWYKIITFDKAGNSVETLIEYVHYYQPGPFTLISDASIPDEDGVITLIWTESEQALNYSIYIKDITSEAESTIIYKNGITTLSYTISGLQDGIYNITVVAFSEYGNYTASWLQIEIKLLQEIKKKNEPESDLGNILLLINSIIVIGTISVVSVIIIERKNRIIR